jgi:PAS domain S-box-containing protein
MKLFTKTLLFFISVIIFQFGLTIFFITNITKRSNLEDAVKELKSEATIVFDNYNSWKRGIWKSLIEIQHDQQILEIVQNDRSASFQKTFTGYLKEVLHVSGGDIFFLRNSSHAETDIIPMTYNNFSFSDLQTLENSKIHPYIELRVIGNQLCMVGITRLKLGVGAGGQVYAYVDLFIIRRIDRDFCDQLVLNRSSHALFLLDTQYLSGTLDEKTFVDTFGFTNFDTDSYEIHDIEMGKIGYNLAVQRIETLQIANRSHKLFLVTLLSNAPYITRLTVLEKTVLYVTVLSALLTIILSLFLSRNITQPIRNLLSAMQSIRSGKYDTTIELQAQNEIGELVQGFNEMARKIHQDKEQMENYLHEIIFLKDYNEKIIHSIGAGMIIINRSLDIEKVNSAFLDYFHLDEDQVLGKNIWNVNLDIIDDAIVNDVQAILQKDKEECSQIKRAKKNKVYEIKLYPIDNPDETRTENWEALGCVFVVEDISRKIEFEEKIFQAEKLSSISMLSAGVAHEINNPLSSIMTNVQNLIEEEEDQEKCVALKWIEQETRRIARIVQKLLDFSSSQLDNTQGTDVNKVIEDTITLIKYSLKKNQQIAMTTDLEEDLPLAIMSSDEFKQMIINLVKNSIQAIQERGEILIKTRNSTPDQTICVSIEDNGVGIKEETIPRIFDPFFTTKQNGEGTGLGLSVVYGIINKYKGTIAVTSKEGKGTQVCLTIPMLENR